MLGLLVIIVISWMLLHFIEKKDIAVLGIVPNTSRIIQFVIGFLAMAAIVSTTIYAETIFQQIKWKSNVINYSLLWNAFVYHLRSALTEDLVFRGAILYILIQKIGAKKAILISALCFGVYHVFSYGIMGERIFLIIYVIVVTGFTGYVWAYAFYKTKSIMLGLGFHLGYNLIMSCFFEAQPYGELILAQISKVKLTGWNEFYFSIFKGLFPPLITLLFVKLYIQHRFNQREKDD